MKKRRVWPVAGRYLMGVPHVPHECDDPACTESGAFTTEPPPEVATIPTEDPPDGGSSESQEA